jgi:hypothetical protein
MHGATAGDLFEYQANAVVTAIGATGLELLAA